MKLKKLKKVLALSVAVSVAVPGSVWAAAPGEKMSVEEYEAGGGCLPEGFHYILDENGLVTILDDGSAAMEENISEETEDPGTEISEEETEDPETETSEEETQDPETETSEEIQDPGSEMPEEGTEDPAPENPESGDVEGNQPEAPESGEGEEMESETPEGENAEVRSSGGPYPPARMRSSFRM